MAKLKNAITGRLPNLLKNKGSQQARFPSRKALKMFGSKQGIDDYAQFPPSGANAPGSYNTILDMGKQGPVVAPGLDDE